MILYQFQHYSDLTHLLGVFLARGWTSHSNNVGGQSSIIGIGCDALVAVGRRQTCLGGETGGATPSLQLSSSMGGTVLPEILETAGGGDGGQGRLGVGEGRGVLQGEPLHERLVVLQRRRLGTSGERQRGRRLLLC